jgi:amino acid transporter
LIADGEATQGGAAGAPSLFRTLDWTDAFWVASGAPALVLFTVGAIASTIGQPSWVIWILSITIGFVQSFTYAEISGLFPHKSGGASVYGAIAWVRYSKFVAPISVWCNWIAWSPVLALGTSLAAGYVLSAMFSPDSMINRWSLTLVSLEFLGGGLTLRINAVSILATVFLLTTFGLQHRGVARAAGVQKILGVASLLPLLVIGIVPIVTGDMPVEHLLPLLPMAHDAEGKTIFGAWNSAGWTLAMGSMFIAGWSTYGFETAVCYTREFKDPKADTFKAIFYSGILCLLIFSLVPLTFQGAMGLNKLLDKTIYDGTGVGIALAKLVGGGAIVTNLIVVMLILSLLLSVTTSMMGSSRTLYQASIDGWLPRYLSRVNEHGSPTRAMWTDLGFNVILLLMSDYFAVLAVSNVCYFFFCFLNLQAGWIHRLDRECWERPFKCPSWLLALGCFFGYLDMAFVGAGADLWGRGTLRNGLLAIGLIVPVFVFRHYIQDKGKFPGAMLEDMDLRSDAQGKKRAGMLPFIALGLCVLVIWVAHTIAVLPFKPA